jgi:hypothetical protein
VSDAEVAWIADRVAEQIRWKWERSDGGIDSWLDGFDVLVLCHQDTSACPVRLRRTRLVNLDGVTADVSWVGWLREIQWRDDGQICLHYEIDVVEI